MHNIQGTGCVVCFVAEHTFHIINKVGVGVEEDTDH